MTDTFEYTKAYENLDSSVIDAVFYNENDHSAVLDVNGTYYKYDKVPQNAVTDLINAPSIGASYNTHFKRVYGPSTEVGSWADVTEIYVAPRATVGGTAKDLTPPTSINAHTVTPTKEYSLKTPPANVVNINSTDLKVKSVVFFTMDGVVGKTFEFPSNKDSLVDAITELDDYVSRLGQRGKVTKVVFEFE